MEANKHGNIPESLDQKKLFDIMELACSQGETGMIGTKEMVDVLASFIKGNGSYREKGQSFYYRTGE